MRKLFTVWNTSSSPSALTRSKILLSAMNVPVRPAPALQSTNKKGGGISGAVQDEQRPLEVGRDLPAVHNNGMIPRLLLLPLNRGDDVDHTFPLGGDAHLRPAVEVEVSDHPRLLLLFHKKTKKRLIEAWQQEETHWEQVFEAFLWSSGAGLRKRLVLNSDASGGAR